MITRALDQASHAGSSSPFLSSRTALGLSFRTLSLSKGEESASPTSAAIGPDTLLKVAHHGSRTSTTPAFLALAAPEAAIISVGPRNTVGHPRPEIIARLAAAHTLVYRTDKFGLTTFLLTRDGRISTLPPASNP